MVRAEVDVNLLDRPRFVGRLGCAGEPECANQARDRDRGNHECQRYRPEPSVALLAIA
jgi:hypothetical protein